MDCKLKQVNLSLSSLHHFILYSHNSDHHYCAHHHNFDHYYCDHHNGKRHDCNHHDDCEKIRMFCDDDDEVAIIMLTVMTTMMMSMDILQWGAMVMSINEDVRHSAAQI